MADLHGILVRPMITEKSSQAWQDRQEYVFEVHPEATKDQIKTAVQRIYKVRVTGVNTQVRKHKDKKTRFGVIADPSTKKATVTLHADDVIELF